jgi:hypothetical protein
MKAKIILPTFMIIGILLVYSCKKETKDTTAPVITLLGDNPFTLCKDAAYTDPGATAYDETDGDLTANIQVTNNLNTGTTGQYQMKYNVSDKAGNAAAEVVRTVDVINCK